MPGRRARDLVGARAPMREPAQPSVDTTPPLQNEKETSGLRGACIQTNTRQVALPGGGNGTLGIGAGRQESSCLMTDIGSTWGRPYLGKRDLVSSADSSLANSVTLGETLPLSDSQLYMQPLRKHGGLFQLPTGPAGVGQAGSWAGVCSCAQLCPDWRLWEEPLT